MPAKRNTSAKESSSSATIGFGAVAKCEVRSSNVEVKVPRPFGIRKSAFVIPLADIGQGARRHLPQCPASRPLPAFKAEVVRFSKGVWSSRLRLYPEGLHKIWIPVPPISEQKAIISHIQAHQTSTAALESALRDSTALLKERRSALITSGVTGQFECPILPP